MQINVLTALLLLTSSVTTVIAQTPIKAPYFSGFNYGATKPNGACKTRAEWEQEFRKVKSWSPNTKALFNVAKLFSTADCNTLDLAVPAALAAGVKIWAGVWPVDAAKFIREKAALEAAIKKYGDANKWLMGINVGSESLYRKEIDPNVLAGYIYDVKGMVQQAYGIKVPVGSADTWTSWVEDFNKPVVTASDVILMNGFPYWQGVAPGTNKQALTTFRSAIWETRKKVGTKQIIIGETGWPSVGENFGAAIPSVANLRTYYKDVSCWLMNDAKSEYPWFWFSAFDQPERGTGVEGNFGIATSSQSPKVNFKAVC